MLFYAHKGQGFLTFTTFCVVLGKGDTSYLRFIVLNNSDKHSIDFVYYLIIGFLCFAVCAVGP